MRASVPRHSFKGAVQAIGGTILILAFTAGLLHMAYDLGRRAFEENPDCDAIYIGGGTWLAEPVAERLEQEFGKPAICNQTAQLRDILHTLKAWAPIPGHGRVLAAA